MQRTFDADAARAIGDAVRELESRSAAEVVVEIRTASGSYAHADARFAALLALLSLIGVVFLPLTVPPIAVIVDPIIVYLGGLVIARRSSALRRMFSSRKERNEAVRMQAAALFHDRGVADTSGETGILFFASILERRIEVLPDRGILRRLVPHDWNALITDLRTERTIDTEAILAALRSLGVLLARDVPRGDDDVNELSDLPEIGA